MRRGAYSDHLRNRTARVDVDVHFGVACGDGLSGLERGELPDRAADIDVDVYRDVARRFRAEGAYVVAGLVDARVVDVDVDRDCLCGGRASVVYLVADASYCFLRLDGPALGAVADIGESALGLIGTFFGIAKLAVEAAITYDDVDE